MSRNFTRLLSKRLEQLCWIDVILEDCLFVEFLDRMDFFFMSSDLKFWDRPPGFISGNDDIFIGSMEDWALHRMQEQLGYCPDYEDDADERWMESDIDDECSECEVWLVACKALGLGGQGVGSESVVGRPGPCAASSLASPWTHAGRNAPDSRGSPALLCTRDAEPGGPGPVRSVVSGSSETTGDRS